MLRKILNLIFTILKPRKNSSFSQSLKREISEKYEKKVIVLTKKDIKRYNLEIKLSNTLIQDIIIRTLYSGIRSETIAKELTNNFSNVTQKELDMIFRTIIFTTQFNLGRLRAEDVGVNWYQWSAGGTCPKHKHMNDVFVRWTTPPTPNILKDENFSYAYHAGCIAECKCFASPIVGLDYIKPPYKVYTGKEIIKLGKRKFIDMYGETIKTL